MIRRRQMVFVSDKDPSSSSKTETRVFVWDRDHLSLSQTKTIHLSLHLGQNPCLHLKRKQRRRVCNIINYITHGLIGYFASEIFIFCRAMVSSGCGFGAVSVVSEYSLSAASKFQDIPQLFSAVLEPILQDDQWIPWSPKFLSFVIFSKYIGGWFWWAEEGQTCSLVESGSYQVMFEFLPLNFCDLSQVETWTIFLLNNNPTFFLGKGGMSCSLQAKRVKTLPICGCTSVYEYF